MKKCASCTKDLPDAALHCVFCGAKQPPAPATAGSVAKTVMGHASNEMIEQLKAQAAAAAARQAPSNLPAAAPYTVPQPPPGSGTGHGVPSAGSVAPTMFVPGGGPSPAPLGAGPGPMGTGPMGPGPAPMGGPGPMGGPMGGPMPGPGPMGPGPMGPGPMGPGPMGPGPMGPGPAPLGSPSAPPPPIQGNVPGYLAKGRTGGRPVEPWKDTLRLMMFIWGGALIVAFLVPVTTEPELSFMFNAIIDAPGTAKLGPLLIASIGLLGIVLAAIPTSPSPRGLIAGLLGLAGILIPTLLLLSEGEFGLGQILILISLVGLLTLIPGLLLRSEYRDAMLPRILVTVGVLCVLVTMLIPQNDSIPLIEAFKAIIDAPGKGKVLAIIKLGPPVIAVLSLLAWLPAPSSGGAKVFAWLLIAWFGIDHFASLLINGGIGSVVSASPNGALVSWVPMTAYLVFVGFGFATVFGKKLE